MRLQVGRDRYVDQDGTLDLVEHGARECGLVPAAQICDGLTPKRAHETPDLPRREPNAEAIHERRLVALPERFRARSRSPLSAYFTDSHFVAARLSAGWLTSRCQITAAMPSV